MLRLTKSLPKCCLNNCIQAWPTTCVRRKEIPKKDNLNYNINMKNRNALTRACVAVLAIGAAAIALLPTATRAQTNVWHDDFDQNPVGANSTDGTYGRIAYNFS